MAWKRTPENAAAWVTKVEPMIKAPPFPPTPNPLPSHRESAGSRLASSKASRPRETRSRARQTGKRCTSLFVRCVSCGSPRVTPPSTPWGCERLFSPTASDRDRRFQILISLMMSSQTKDTVNAVAMGRLHDELPPHEAGAPPGLNLENILAVEPAKLNELIRVQEALLLRDNFDADIPPTIDGLTSLPGVGPKMAHLCLSAAWGRTEGIGVDVHVHRITNMWGVAQRQRAPRPRASPLEAWLPRDRWHEINTLLVGLRPEPGARPQAGRRRLRASATFGLARPGAGAERPGFLTGFANGGPDGRGSASVVAMSSVMR
ncbi:DNA base excision repair N-glycosylase [Verticillium alfalfae VaMs.102]|uniref:DNA base excision repair N-glycosylase n=1 Tax=Verticillium alfalfae (strain VaMs.102 / ATCC MYA-4576 / FGSC 10136) TaxID=526221 RepID=C9S6J7_VERA1|nr:DNA base excision repair N-glycosylase [Verticillium alfalfae VaMs.102]EEY14488.1 DNA base excision repair N-glycosylase [Verticillium alfalfae VaMs.102]